MHIREKSVDELTCGNVDRFTDFVKYMRLQKTQVSNSTDNSVSMKEILKNLKIIQTNLFCIKEILTITINIV